MVENTIFVLMFTQYKAQEAVKVERYCVVLYDCKERREMKSCRKDNPKRSVQDCTDWKTSCLEFLP